MSGFLNFDLLCALLLKLDTVSNPAELHGALCGKLAGGQRLGHGDWQSFALEFMDVRADMNDDIGAAFNGFYDETLTQLSDDQLSFQLLLPDDDSDIAERLTSLGQWSSGFLNGLGTSGVDGSKFSAESRESLEDLAAISRVDSNQVSSEEADQEYHEIYEYVRVVVLNIFAETGLSYQQPDSSKAH